MNRHEIRQLNLLVLIAESNDNINELSKATGVPAAYLSHCKNGVRNIGDKTAEALEDGKGKPRGWMDIPHIPDGHKVAVADVHNRLLKLPRHITDLVAALLRVIENPGGGDDLLGHIDLAKPRAGKTKGRVITLKDHAADKKPR